MASDNEADWDRATRIFIGIIVLYAGWGGFVEGAAATLLIAVGIFALATGLVGWCPFYEAVHLSTRAVAGRRD